MAELVVKDSSARSIRFLSLLGIAAAVVAAPAASQVSADEDIVVHGALPVCLPRADDPLDRVKVRLPDYRRQMVIKADRNGVYRVRPDDDPITGPILWQRAGTAIPDYVFRVPSDGFALCIGAKKPQRNGWAQLRRVLDAVPLRGRYARFTAFTTRTRAEEVRFWLAAGGEGRVLQGGDTRVASLTGSGDWVQVTLTIGPIPDKATKLSYGFLLYGRGDVWVDEPRLEILTEVPPAAGAPIRLTPIRRRVLP